MTPNVDGRQDIGADDDIGVDDGERINDDVCVDVQYGGDDVDDDVNA